MDAKQFREKLDEIIKTADDATAEWERGCPEQARKLDAIVVEQADALTLAMFTSDSRPRPA